MRQHDRVKAEVPVDIEGDSRAMTKDVSPGGVFIVADGAFVVGQVLQFTIEFDNPVDGGGLLCLECSGIVKRVDRNGAKMGIGVTITDSRLERRSRRTAPVPPRARATARR
jgi:hypothetical protein